MLARLLQAVVSLALFGAVGMQAARADIYTWVDASGGVNISNIDPPDGARIINVVKANSVSPAAPRSDSARDAEMQALADRVRQLQDAVDQSRRQAPAPVAYQYAPPPPVMQYADDSAPYPPQYADYLAPQTNGCDPSWGSCGLWWGGVYPAGIVVVRAPPHRRFFPGHPGHHAVAPHPVYAAAGARRR
jgi:hypothetical protein